MVINIPDWLLIGLGAGLGSIWRHFLVKKNIGKLFSKYFSGVTLANIIASTLFGFLFSIVDTLHPFWVPHDVYVFLTAGVFGGLSTFSTMIIQSKTNKKLPETFLYLLVALFSGFTGFLIGVFIGNMVSGVI